MQAVSFPDVVVSFNLALNEILEIYLLNGGLFSILRQDILFYRCQLLYDRQGIIEPSDRPRIAMLGNRPMRESGGSGDNNNSPGKCQDEFGRVFVKRYTLERAIHVMVPRGKLFESPPYNDPGLHEATSKLMVDRVWQNLIAIFQHERAAFRERGIWSIGIDDFPQENSDDQWWINSGMIKADVQYAVPQV